MDRASIKRWVGTLAVLNLAAIAIVNGPPSFSNASHAVRGLTNPILAMEVARDVPEVDAILSDAPSADREVMRIKQYADFGFICCYSALFVAMGALLAPYGRAAAIGAAVVGLIAAVLDVVENVGILRVVDLSLSHTTQAAIDAIRYPSLAKWALVSIATGILATLAMRAGSTGLRIAGGFNLLAALLGAGGVVNNVLLAWAGLPMLGGLLTLAVLFFRPYYSRRRT